MEGNVYIYINSHGLTTVDGGAEWHTVEDMDGNKIRAYGKMPPLMPRQPVVLVGDVTDGYDGRPVLEFKDFRFDPDIGMTREQLMEFLTGRKLGGEAEKRRKRRQSKTDTHKSRGMRNDTASRLADRFESAGGFNPYRVLDGCTSRTEAEERLSASGKNVTDAGKGWLTYVTACVMFDRFCHTVRSQGGSYGDAMAAWHDAGRKAPELFENDPYKLVSSGVSFEICDRQAKQVYKSDMTRTLERARAGAYDILTRAERRGDTVVTVDGLTDQLNDFLGTKYTPDIVKKYCRLSRGLVIHDDGTVQKQDTALSEEYAAGKIRKIAEQRRTGIKYKTTPQEFRWQYGSPERIVLNDKQLQVLEEIQHGGVIVLTGGPGRGKTTVLKAVLQYYTQEHPEEAVLLAAPTATAAAKLQAATGCPERWCKTIHLLLHMHPDDYGIMPDRNTGGDNPIRAGLLIIDEASMVDTSLLKQIMINTDERTTVLLVGDPGQLESVRCGSVLRDLIAFAKDTGKIPIVELEKVYRTGTDGESIREAAEAIQDGRTDFKRDVHFFAQSYPNIYTLKDDLGIYYRNSQRRGSCLCITPYSDTRHAGCADDLNGILQSELNPRRGTGDEVELSGTVYRINDKVTFTHNSYKRGYINGGDGVITSVYKRGRGNPWDMVTVDIENKGETNIDADRAGDMVLGYAKTVHKAQGAEYDTIILVVPGYSTFISRRLLYVAATRAKKELIILSVRDDGTGRDAFTQCVTENTGRERVTKFVDVLRKEFGNA